jgi:hypothetical protein
MFVKFGTTASLSSWSAKLLPGDYLEENFYSGNVDAIWDATGGSSGVTSIS